MLDDRKGTSTKNGLDAKDGDLLEEGNARGKRWCQIRGVGTGQLLAYETRARSGQIMQTRVAGSTQLDFWDVPRLGQEQRWMNVVRAIGPVR